MYNYYSKVTGGKLDEATLKQLNLENTVLQTLINQALLQNFAEENEMRVSDEEVASKIASMEPFQKNGKFDKEQYVMALKNATYRDWETDRKSTRLNSSHITRSRMPSSA